MKILRNQTHKKSILVFSGVLIILSLLFLFLSMRDLPKCDYSIDDWKSKYAVYRDNGFGIAEEYEDSGEPLEYFLWGPNKELKKGSYSVLIDYYAEDDQNCYVEASGEERKFVSASTGILNRYQKSVIYQFEIKRDINSFELVFSYSGKGDFVINSITINANNNQIKRSVSVFIFLVLMADFLVLMEYQSKEKRQIVIFIVGIAALTSIPMFVSDIHRGDDLEFHLMRIETIVQALRDGQFPARLSSVILYGAGYPTPIYYNDLFLYIPAFLRFLGFSLVSVYKIYVVLINLLTSCLAYISFSRIFKSRRVGLVLSLVYCSSSYRLVNVWMRSAVGEYTAQAFLPLLAWAIYRIFSDEKKHIKVWIWDSVLLAAAFTGITGAHIITLVMSVFMLFWVCVIYIKKLFRGQVVLTFLVSASLILLLNLYYLAPFWDYYINVPSTLDSGTPVFIQNESIFPGMLFGFFQKLTGISGSSVTDRFQTTPGLPLMIILFFSVFLLLNGNSSQKLKGLLFLSVLSLWLSTNLFPWDWLSIHFPLWRYMTRIQFPWRFLTFAVLFLTIMTGSILKQNIFRYLDMILVSLSVIMAFWLAGDYFNHAHLISISDSSSLYCVPYDRLYYLPGSSPENLENLFTAEMGKNMQTVEILSRTPGRMRVYCKTNDLHGDHRVAVPLYNYKGYIVSDDSDVEYKIETDELNRVMFELPDGFEGTINVVFREPVIWKISLLISIIMAFAILSSCTICVYRKNEYGKKKNY